MLDELGQRIVQLLQEDARQSYREIGRKLGVSEGTIRKRVRSLVGSGIIKLSVVPNPQQLGFNFLCVVGIEVKVGCVERAENLLIQSPNVYFLCGCTGIFDIIGILIFRTAAEFDDFIKNITLDITDIVRTQTFVVMHTSRTPWDKNLDIAALLKPREQFISGQ